MLDAYEYKRCRQLLINNPGLTLKDFKNLTGYSKNIYYKIKHELLDKRNSNIREAEKLEDAELRIKIKRKLKLELIESLKREGYLNAKGTFIERM